MKQKARLKNGTEIQLVFYLTSNKKLAISLETEDGRKVFESYESSLNGENSFHRVSVIHHNEKFHLRVGNQRQNKRKSLPKDLAQMTFIKAPLIFSGEFLTSDLSLIISLSFPPFCSFLSPLLSFLLCTPLL